MAQNGVDVDLNFDRTISRVTAAMAATPKQIEKASERAIKKTIRWLSTRIAREVAQALGISQKAFKRRMSVSAVGRGADRVHILWLGVAPMAAEQLSQPRQTRRGVSVGRRRFRGAFHRDVYGDGPGVWIRKARAHALGLDLPSWGGQRNRGGSQFTERSENRGRFPVMRVAVAIEPVAAEVFRRYNRRAEDRFATVLDQELNFVVNHE